MAIFKNYGERLPIMEKLRQQLINEGLLSEECKDKSIANNGYGCRLSHGHGLPFYVFIGISTDENGDYAFLRFWQEENKKTHKKRIKKRRSFLENNAKEIHNFLGKKDVSYYSYKKHQVNRFKITDDDSIDKGFIAYYTYRESENELWNDLIRMSKVLRLIMENEKMLPHQLKQPKETIPGIDDENIIKRPCFLKKRVSRKLFLTNATPKDSDCREVIIVGPYPTKGFVNRVKNEMKPEHIYVIVDSSWKEDEIEEIKKENVIVKKVQTDDGYGIVHAKMYLVEYSNNETQLFFGSVNASENSIDNNSEFISSYWLHSFEDKQNDIKNYFNKLKSGQNVGPMEIELKRDNNSYSTLFFPKIQANEGDDINSFRNWIRKGFFFIKYEPDSTLGTMPIVLKENKINQKVMKKILKTLSLEKSSQKMVLRYPYASSQLENVKTEKNNGQWRAKYTVATDMGYWVSYDCVKDLAEKIPPSNELRNKIANFINGLKPQKQEIGANLYKSIENAGIKRYLDIQVQDKFLRDLKEKIEYDQTLLQDKVYLHRFLTGYAKIPASTLNVEFLDRIIENFIDTYIIKSKRKNGKRKSLVKKMANLQVIKDQKDKIDAIEELWKEHQDLFRDYYKSESKK